MNNEAVKYLELRGEFENPDFPRNLANKLELLRKG